MPTNNKQKYCKECGIIVRKEQRKQYSKTHLKELKESQCKYDKTEKGKERNRKYNETERAKECHRRYHKTERGKICVQKENDKKRGLRYIPLNSYQKGDEFHHMDISYGIYVPAEVHRSISHCLETGRNMAVMNALAFNYL